MFNHNRGLWGYTGAAVDGLPLTIQSTGMGGPSAAIVIAELIQLGARRLVRIGTCAGFDPRRLSLGDLVVVSEALSWDGTSVALDTPRPLIPDPSLRDALTTAAANGAHSGAVVSTDLFYDGPDGEEEEWAGAGALVVDMETATLFALAGRRGFAAASLLVVSDLLSPSRIRIQTEPLHAAEQRMGEVAAAALMRGST